MSYWDSDSDIHYVTPIEWSAFEVQPRISENCPTDDNFDGYGQDEYKCRSFDLPDGRKIDIAESYRCFPGEQRWKIIVLENGVNISPEAAGMTEQDLTDWTSDQIDEYYSVEYIFGPNEYGVVWYLPPIEDIKYALKYLKNFEMEFVNNELISFSADSGN